MKRNELISLIILLILGIILLIVPGKIITTIIKIFGVIIIGLGIFNIINTIKTTKNNIELLYGILITILGLILFVNPTGIASIMPFTLGMWIVFKSIFKMRLIRSLKKIGENEWIKPLIVNLITLVLGLILIFNPFEGVTAMLRIIAIFIIIYTILEIIEYFMTKPKKVKVIK